MPRFGKHRGVKPLLPFVRAFSLTHTATGLRHVTRQLADALPNRSSTRFNHGWTRMDTDTESEAELHAPCPCEAALAGARRTA